MGGGLGGGVGGGDRVGKYGGEIWGGDMVGRYGGEIWWGNRKKSFFQMGKYRSKILIAAVFSDNIRKTKFGLIRKII